MVEELLVVVMKFEKEVQVSRRPNDWAIQAAPSAQLVSRVGVTSFRTLSTLSCCLLIATFEASVHI